MTNTEAINSLKALLRRSYEPTTAEALRMAIKALEKVKK